MPEQVPVRAVRTGGLDHLTVPTRDETLIAALERERLGYVQRNLPARVAAVDEQLRLLRGDQPAGEPVRRGRGRPRKER